MKIVLALSVVLAAVSARAGNGGSAGAFLTLPVGARSAGLAEGGVALAVDAHALFLNPAAMAALKTASVVGTHGAYIDSSFIDQIAYVRPLSGGSAWGAGLQYFSAGSVDETDLSGSTVGSFTPSDLALSGGYARTLGSVRVGGSLKYIRSTLVDSASALSLDLGVESNPLAGNKLKLGLAGQNLIGSLKYEQESSDLPMTVKAGAAYTVKGNWDAVLDVAFPKDEDSYYSVGTEYRLKMADPWGLALRGGYNTRTSDVDGFTGFSLGLGVTRQAMTVDYAFLPFGDVGSTHWITLGWRVGGDAVKKNPAPTPVVAPKATPRKVR